MANPQRYTKAELLEKYESSRWRTKFIRTIAISSLLKGCIIGPNYRIPDDLNDAIALSEQGQQAINHLVAKGKVGVKEAKLQCLLKLAYLDVLINIDGLDLDAIVESIGKQILAGELRFPYIFGRFLYDAVADSFTEEREYLNEDETQRVLDVTPKGVWQADDVIVGPFGVIRSEYSRGFIPRQRLSLQHCTDPLCGMLHSVYLSTSSDALINRAYVRMDEYLKKLKLDPSDWAGFIEEVTKPERAFFDDLDPSSIPYALADLMSLKELSLLLGYLIDKGMARPVRTFLENHGKSGSWEALVSNLSHAEIIQLLLIQSDSVIASAVDECVKSGMIDVPTGEIRRLRIHQKAALGAWDLQPELGAHGIRFVSNMPGLPQLRLRKLLSEIFPSSDEGADSDLSWQLRSIGGLGNKGKLETFIRTTTPDAVVRRLILRDREKADRACSRLGVSWSERDGDDYLVDSIVWKLGFDPVAEDGSHSEFWRKHNEMTNLAQTASLSTVADEDKISAGAGVYFRGLEGMLENALVYSTWALCSDHLNSARPFVYDYEMSRSFVMETLAQASVAMNSDQISFGENNTLYPIIRGFDILAEHLKSMQNDIDTELYSRVDLPEYHMKTKIKEFPLLHTIAFLDLLPESRTKIILDLKEFSRALTASGIVESRNSLLHFRRSSADVNKLTAALESVRAAIRRAEQSGIVRTLYVRSGSVTDEWGRSTVGLKGYGGQEVTFFRPTSFDWLGMPDLESPQFLFHSAIFEEPNEMLRYFDGRSSEYSDLWSKFPRRPVTLGASVANHSKSTVGSVEVQ
ncbi:hypothetical protein [Nocardia harenae]|uniref:hypothetical protein n=1 Tax=Nocardia harenae TaxID=358707 RepID=UPI000A93B80E|nr:hypothetical protein [Nocardia harenae]